MTNNVPFAYGLCMLLFFIGLYGVITKKNLVKIIISILIMNNAVNLFILLLGFRSQGKVPIMTADTDALKFALRAMDPLPQAMVLSSIVIGFSIAALMVAVAVRLYKRYGTMDISKIRELRE